MSRNQLLWDRISKDFVPVRGYDHIYVYHVSDFPEYSAQVHLSEVLKFAQVTGQLEQFQSRVLEYFQHYAEPKDIRVLMTKDFAPYSFGFRLGEIVKEDGVFMFHPWFDGGIIYHGPHDGFGDGGAPTYSVSLGNAQGWSVHT